MYRYSFIFLCVAFMAINGCRSLCPQLKPVTHGIMVLDGGNRRVNSLEVGSSLHVSARGLEPNQLYEFRLGINSEHVSARGLEPNQLYEFPLGINSEEIASLDQVVSFARLSTDRNGNIPSFILQYHSGVIGCSPRIKGQKFPRHMYRTFDEAENNLSGGNMNISVHPVQSDPKGKIALMKLKVGKAGSKIQIPIIARKNPMIYPSDVEGCLLNSAAVQEQDMYVSGRNFKPEEVVQISIVPNQRSWYIDDPINDITGVGGANAQLRVKADQNGRFTVRVWDSERQRRGVYDIVAQRIMDEPELPRLVRKNDIISYGSDSAFILFMRYPVGGPTMDIAGRPISGSPYFQFSDSFAENDDAVWGAVDPTYVHDGHLGGRYAAYYVVNHRDVNGWDPSVGGSINLVDVSAGSSIEIMPIKSGCVNGTDIVIWEPPLTLGEYDVVVDFGNSPAETRDDYATDGEYTEPVDFLDGADQIGFVVAKDPYEVALAPYVPGETYPVGQAEYSDDNFFAALGNATDVDLRAVVRYPATANGIVTPVAAGQHPLFIIEHGNHFTCEIALDGRPYYDVVQEYRDGQISWPEFLASLHSYDSCTQRTPNHQGYMGLLDILASHGIIAVSIDAYDLTGCTSSGCAPQYPIERGTLILKHIQLWSHMNDPSTYDTEYSDFFSGNFANHVDLSKISVSGHSRGGEASVKAYLINASNPAEYGFSIGSVSSIAPMDFDHSVLPDVPYFVIIPAADGDVSDLYGVRIYDNAGSTEIPVDLTTKSGIDVYGANHNFFNTVWADDGDDSWTSRDDYIFKEDQQRIGEAYLAAFTRIHLNNEQVYEDMLRGQLIFPSTAGFKIYHFRHEKSHSKVEDGDGAHVTIPVAPATAVTTSSISGPSVHDSQALQVNWSQYTDQLVYTVPVGQRDASAFEVLSFRVAQTNSTDNPASTGQDFQVELIGGGKDKTTWAKYFGQIPHPYDRNDVDHNVMTTVRIPLHSFIMNKSGVKLENIDTIKFKFSNPNKGEIYVDDIEFSR